MSVDVLLVPRLHRAWRIVEIVDMIIAQSLREGQTGTLARLARTHSSFFEPAITHLWRKVDARQLLRLFDFVEKDLAYLKCTKSQTRYLTYLGSVRSLKLGVDGLIDGSTPHNPVISDCTRLIDFANVMSIGGPRFLPNMYDFAIDWTFYDLDLTSLTSLLVSARLLLSDVITILHIQLDRSRANDDSVEAVAEEDQVLHLLRMVKLNCPRLKSFSIAEPRAQRTTLSFIKAVGDVISGSKDLQVFKGGSWTLTQPIISSLATLPALASLCMTPEDAEHAVDEPSARAAAIGKCIGAEAFSVLQDLRLHGSPEIIDACLRACAPTLKSLIITTFSGSLSLVCLASTITRFLSLAILWWTNECQSAVSLGICHDILIALAPCKELLRLTLHICDHTRDSPTEPFSLSPIISAWPQLRHIQLCWIHLFTFSELVHLADQCPSIHSVSLGLSKEGQVVVPYNIIPSERRINFWISTPLQHPAQEVALFLHSIWPRVVLGRPSRRTAHYDLAFSDVKRTWEPVIAIIKALQNHEVLLKELMGPTTSVSDRSMSSIIMP